MVDAAETTLLAVSGVHLFAKSPRLITMNPEDPQLNETLDDVILLLEREIERLKTSLETFRLTKPSDITQQQEIIRWHVRTLDARQDTLDELKDLLIATREEESLH